MQQEPPCSRACLLYWCTVSVGWWEPKKFSDLSQPCHSPAHRVPRESVKVGNRRKASQKQAPALASQLLGVHWPVGQALPFPPNGAPLSAQKRRKDRQVEGEVALVPRAELSWLPLGDRVLAGHQMATSPLRGRPCGHTGMAGLTPGKCSLHKNLEI